MKKEQWKLWWRSSAALVVCAAARANDAAGTRPAHGDEAEAEGVLHAHVAHSARTEAAHTVDAAVAHQLSLLVTQEAAKHGACTGHASNADAQGAKGQNSATCTQKPPNRRPSKNSTRNPSRSRNYKRP
jgi:hypothetical protein